MKFLDKKVWVLNKLANCIPDYWFYCLSLNLRAGTRLGLAINTKYGIFCTQSWIFYQWREISDLIITKV